MRRMHHHQVVWRVGNSEVTGGTNPPSEAAAPIIQLLLGKGLAMYTSKRHLLAAMLMCFAATTSAEATYY